MTREELIAALEAATEPSEELDLKVATWCLENGAIAGVSYDPMLWLLRNEGFVYSIDAAMTLVPKNAGIEIRRYWLSTSISDAIRIIEEGPEAGVAWSATVAWDIDGRTAEAEDKPSAAIALCIAALKARGA